MVVGTAFRHSSVQYHTGNYLLPKNMFGLAAKNFWSLPSPGTMFLCIIGTDPLAVGVFQQTLLC